MDDPIGVALRYGWGNLTVRWHTLPLAHHPRQWQRYDWLMGAVHPDLGFRCSGISTISGGHCHRPSLPRSHIFYTFLLLQSPSWLKNRDSGEKTNTLMVFPKQLEGMGMPQWTLRGVKPPVAVGFFQSFTLAAVFPNSFVSICVIAQRGQNLIKYHKSKAHPDQTE